MQTHAEKHSTFHAETRKSSERAPAFAGHGGGAAPLNGLQAIADASPQVARLRALQAKADAGPRTATTQRQPVAPSPDRSGLPDKLKTGIESLSGMSMDNVRVHYNSGRPAQLNALAYAQGTDIHLAPGQEKHLPHEAWHVVQQAQGRVRPTMQAKGAAINGDAGLEREADAMGQRALQGAAQANHPPLQRVSGVAQSGAVQRVTASESAIGGVLGVEEGGAAWDIVTDIDGWMDEATTGELVAEDDMDERQRLIEGVCLEQGYNEANANRLVLQRPYEKDDIVSHTKKMEGPSREIDGRHEQTEKLVSFEEDDLGVENIRHQLYFEFLYTKTNSAAVQKYIARNPLLATFHTSDVVEAQIEKMKGQVWAEGARDAEYGLGVMKEGFKWERIVISDLINEQFKEWWGDGDESLAHKYAEGGTLDEGEERHFLSQIPNGKLAARNAKAAGKYVRQIDVERKDGQGRSEWTFILGLLEDDSESDSDG